MFAQGRENDPCVSSSHEEVHTKTLYASLLKACNRLEMHLASQSRDTRYLGGARRMQALLILEALEVATLILGAGIEQEKKSEPALHL